MPTIREDALRHDVPDPIIDGRIAILERLGGIAGVTALEVENLDSTGPGWRMLVRFQGWSPGLHAIDVTVVMTIRGDGRMVEGLDGVVERQRARQALARRLGASRPLADVTEDDPAEEGDLVAVTRHLLVDRDLLAITREDECWSLVAEIGEGMPGTANTTGYDGGPECGEDGIWVMDTVDGPLAGATYHLEDGSGASFDGRRIVVQDASLPEAVLAAAVGRPVGDVVETHPLLARRTIVAVGSSEDCDGVRTELHVDPIPVPLHPDAWTDGEDA